MRPLAIIVPTRGRPQNVARLVALDAPEVDWYFCVDSDDAEAVAYAEALKINQAPEEHEGKLWCSRDGDVVLVTGAPQRMVPWINQISASDVLAEYDYVGFMGDDHLPRTPHWDQRICEALHRLGTGIVYKNDLLQCEKLPTVGFMTTDIVRALGYMAPPCLEHMFVDNFWLDIGRAIRRIKYLGDVVIEHVHPAAGKAPMDASYETTSPMMITDGKAYAEYKASEFFHDVVKLEALLKAVAP